MKTKELKKHILLIVVLVLLSNFGLKAQLKVTNGGNVGIGYTSPALKLAINGSALVPYDNHLYLNYGSDSHWRFGKDYEYDNVISLYGMGNVYNRNFRIFGYASLFGDAKVFWVRFRDGRTYSNSGFFTASDVSFKKDIEDITGALDKVKNLKGVKYKLKSNLDKSKSTDTLVAEIDDKFQLGLIAQEVEKIIPEVVDKTGEGTLTIDYSKLTVILIEALKEQQEQIEDLMDKIDKGKSASSEKNNNTSVQNSLDSPSSDDIINSIKLYQNRPNPFSDKTVINAYIPVEVNSANLYIYDMQGGQIKSLNILNRGNIEEFVNGNELKPGMYLYSLITDNFVIDTKTMILTD